MAKYGADNGPTEIDENFLPSRPDMDVEEYNALVAPRRERRNGYEGERS